MRSRKGCETKGGKTKEIAGRRARPQDCFLIAQVANIEHTSRERKDNIIQR